MIIKYTGAEMEDLFKINSPYDKEKSHFFVCVTQVHSPRSRKVFKWKRFGTSISILKFV